MQRQKLKPVIPRPKEAGPVIIYPNQIDDKESGAIDTLDRVLALNVGDPSGSYNKLKSIYGPKGYEFSQSTGGDIVFKSKASPMWSRLDPGTKDESPITSLGGVAPNKIFPDMEFQDRLENNIQNLKEFGRDTADIVPDLVQQAGTGALSMAGGFLGAGVGKARTGMSIGAGIGGGLGETARQVAGKITGYREGPFDLGKIAMQAGIDAAIPNIFGLGASAQQIEKAMIKPSAWEAIKQYLPWAKESSDAPIDLGVKVLNEAKKGLTDPTLSPEMLPDAVNQFKENTRGLLPGMASAIWNGKAGLTKEVKDIAYRKMKPSQIDLLKKSGVEWGVGVKPPETLADAAPYMATQGRAGKAVQTIQKTAGDAYKEKKRVAGKEIETALGKLTEPIDIRDEAKVFDDAILDLESKKLRDPTGATQYDTTIATLKKRREAIFGAFEEGPPIEELRKDAVRELQLKARKRNMPENRLGDMLYSTPEAAIGRQNEVRKVLDAMTPEEQSVALGIEIPRDVMGTPMTPPPISNEQRRKLMEKINSDMFLTPGGSAWDMSLEIPEGLDSMGSKMWATAKAKKMSRQELLAVIGRTPKNTKLPPDVAWSKLAPLKEMAGYFGDNNDLTNSQLRKVAIEAERRLSDKMYAHLDKAAGQNKDLRKQYNIFVNGDDHIAGFIDNVNQGLSTAGKLFSDNKGHVKTAIQEYDKLYGTNLQDQLEVISVAAQFGPKGSWLPKSIGGTTSTSQSLQSMAAGKLAANAVAAAAGLGPTATGLLSGVGELTGGMAGSSKFVRGATKAGRVVDKIYGKMGGDSNPISTRQMLGSPWMNLENTDQNKKLLREREKG